MSRWHADWCASPIIQVGDDQIPRCEKCQASAHARLKTADQPNPVPSVPKDEGYGSLNLSWPPTVTFTFGETATLPQADKSKDDQGARSALGSTSDSPVADQGIGNALSSDEFRLAVLHAAGDKGKSYPIHVDLESYKDTHFPDYDAVSYTWGDENGNSERSHPIYVGDHWDIIFQTKNCCDMLRYLRPSRGMKMLWVDAICIDQNNTDERATQVAKMSQIYSRCSQVWAWLGNDLIPDDLEGLPERRWLHELEIMSDDIVPSSQNHPIQNIFELLERRYFGRVWIIQELVLAPRILIPIRNVIFAADHTTTRKLTRSEIDSANKSKTFWQETEAPWFEHIARGHIDATGLWETLALTSKSRASDFRDKLYGILGLLSFGSNSNLLQPNYDISTRQMGIGFVAHCIVNERKPQLFVAARGYAAQKDPSWLPPWETQQTWEKLFMKSHGLIYKDKLDRDHQAGELTMGLEFIDDRSRYFYTKGIVFKSNGLPSKTPLKVRLDELKSRPDCPYPRDFCQVHSWYRDFAVDSDTGSISLWLMRLASISSAPVEALEELFDDLTVYRIHTGPSQSFLVGSQHPLDRVLEQDDEIFVLDPEIDFVGFELRNLVFMVLRKRSDGRHRLVTCSWFLCFCPTPLRGDSYYGRSLTDLQEDVHITAKRLFVQARLNTPVYEVDGSSRWSLDDNGYIFSVVFPGNKDTKVGHILSILTGHESFERLQENEVCARRGQKVTGDYLEFEFEIDLRRCRGNSIKEQLQAAGGRRAFCSWMEWEWRRPGEENSLLWRRLPQLRPDITHEDLGLPGGMMRLHLRCRQEAVRKLIADMAKLWGITALWESHMFGDTLEAFEKNIRSEVTEEDLLIPSLRSGRSGKSLRPEEFAGLDGGIYRVCIA